VNSDQVVDYVVAATLSALRQSVTEKRGSR